MVSFIKSVCKSHTFVSVHPNKLVSPIINFIFEHLKLVTLRRVLLWCLNPTLEHEERVNNESEAVLHLHVEERTALFLFLKQQLDTLYVVLLFRIQY